MKKIICIIVIALSSYAAQSQGTLDLHFGTSGFYGGMMIYTAQGGFTLGLQPSNRLLLYVGGNYYLPRTSLLSWAGNPFDSLGFGYIEPVWGEHKYSFYSGYVGTRIYFLGGTDAFFSIYGLLEAGAQICQVSYNPDPTWPDSPITEETLVSPIATPGIGCEFNFGAVGIFADSKFNIPITKVEGEKINTYIPLSFAAEMGLRFNLGGGGSGGMGSGGNRYGRKHPYLPSTGRRW